MGFLDRFGRTRFRHTWKLTAQGVIWRLVPAPGDLLVGEERDTDSKTTFHFCVDLPTGKRLWRNPAPGEPWWVGVEAVHRDVVTLHRFAKPDMPEHRGVVVLDTRTGAPLWEDPASHLLLAAGDRLFTGRPTYAGRAIREVHYRTGAELRDWGLDPSGLQAAAREPEASDLPEPVLPVPAALHRGGSPDALRRALALLPPGTDTRSVDAAAWGNLLVLQAHVCLPGHTPAAPAYRNELRLHRAADGEALGTEVLDANVRAVVPSSFMLLGGRLLFVRERKTLVCIAAG